MHIRWVCNHCGASFGKYMTCDDCKKVYCWNCVYTWLSIMRPARGPKPMQAFCCSIYAERFYLKNAPLEELPLLLGEFGKPSTPLQTGLYCNEKTFEDIITDRLAGKRT